MKNKEEISYFTDILCIWAFVSEKRVKELSDEFSDKIQINYHFCSIFGSVKEKMKTSWNNDTRKFGAHVIEVASKFDHIKVHPDIWKDVIPTTSANSHLIIKAVQLILDKNPNADQQILPKLIYKIRQSFFEELQDVSKLDVLYEITSPLNISTNELKDLINNGEALAALNHDLSLAAKLDIKGSPSFVMNSGRQILYGNVGYRLIKANVEELLNSDTNNFASWC